MGVNLVGFIHAEFGLGQGCRCIASALKETERLFTVINYKQAYLARDNDQTWADYEGEARYAVNLVQLNADQIAQARVRLGKEFWNERYQIAHFAWELPVFPKKWRAECEMFHEIWTPSRFCTDAIAEQTKIPVYTMPFAIHPVIEEKRSRAYFHLPENAFLFLCMFDVNSVMERKDPISAIRAYCMAFPKETPEIGFVLKINNAQRDLKQYAELMKAIGTRKDIYIIDAVFSRNDINALIDLCDSFVSLHRSEGFGLVMAEAMYFGKPVIATNWSSNTDFMNAENSLPIDYRLIRLDQNYGAYPKGAYWAQADVEQCSDRMKVLVQSPDTCKRIGDLAARFIRENYSDRASAMFINERIGAIE